MRFDTVVIGGGLAGLTAGIRLLRGGQTCALVSAGQGALHFSSGSFGFYGWRPDGRPVLEPLAALPELLRASPEHPYALLGARAAERLALEAEALFQALGLGLRGSLAAGNHLRLTPLGRLSPAWLSAGDAFTAPPSADGTPRWPWRRLLAVQIKGFLDSQPEVLAQALRQSGLEVSQCEVSLPELERLRKNYSEFRSVTLARALDPPEVLAALAEKLRGPAAAAEAVLLPACLGLRDAGRTDCLADLIGRPVRLAPTLPPSLLGARLSRALAEAYVRLGGVLLPGDMAVGGALEGGARRIGHIRTLNLEDDPLPARNFLLATGGFFSQGLAAEAEKIREPVFGLDLTEIPARREMWAADHFFDDQPFARFGVKTGPDLRGRQDGRPLENLYVAGLVRGRGDALRFGCGAGIALVTALAAAAAILEER